MTRGFMLLEVVVAVGLLVLGLAVIGAQLREATNRTYETDLAGRVACLAESKFAELDAGLINEEFAADSNFARDLLVEEDFGRLFPAFAWRMRILPTGVTDLLAIELEILHDPQREVDQEFDYANAPVVQVYHTLRAIPRPLDLVADFGVAEDKALELNQQLAGVGDGSMDVHKLDASIFGRMDIEEILEILPVLMQAFNAKQSDIANLLPPDLRAQLEALLAAQPASGTEGGEEDQSGTGDGSGGAAESADGGQGQATSGDDAGTDQGGQPATEETGDQTGDGTTETTDTPRERPQRGGGKRGGRS